MRCKCCDIELLKGEYDGLQGDGDNLFQEDMCNRCILESRKIYTIYDKNFQFEGLQEGLSASKCATD